MKIRFEVAKRKSWGWPHFVKSAKRHGKYRALKSGTHVVTCSTMDDAVEIWQVVHSWNYVSYQVEGQMVGRARMNYMIRRYQFRDLTQKWMLDDILKKVQEKRDRGDDDMRWKMGMGPEPGR